MTPWCGDVNAVAPASSIPQRTELLHDALIEDVGARPVARLAEECPHDEPVLCTVQEVVWWLPRSRDGDDDPKCGDRVAEGLAPGDSKLAERPATRWECR